MSELLRYRYFKYTRRGTAPEPVIGVFIVGIPETVLKDFVQKIRSPSTDDAIFQILTQPKLKELLGVGLDPNITYTTPKNYWGPGRRTKFSKHRQRNQVLA
jgi:hypothetical protein